MEQSDSSCNNLRIFFFLKEPVQVSEVLLSFFLFFFCAYLYPLIFFVSYFFILLCYSYLSQSHVRVVYASLLLRVFTRVSFNLSTTTMLAKIPAFLDGNSLVHFNDNLDRLLVGNSEGLIKVFNLEEPESEPTSIDIPENLTSLTSHGKRIILTNTEGHLAILNMEGNITGDESFDIIYRSELPLRDAVFINDGNRVICGGDDDKLVVIDLNNGNKTSIVSVPDQIVNIAYNTNGEIASVALSNGDVLMYSVINESPALIEKITGAIISKVNTSIDVVDFKGEHAQEIASTKPVWSADGEVLFLPTASSTIKAYNRVDWNPTVEFRPQAEYLVALGYSPNKKFLALLHKNGQINLFDIRTGKFLKKASLDRLESGNLPINFAWLKNSIYVGSTNGELHSILIDLDDSPDERTISAEVESLFMDEASELETEERLSKGNPQAIRNGIDDSMIIDENDDMDSENGTSMYNTAVDEYLHSRKKRQRVRPEDQFDIPSFTASSDIIPYSPGSTPWIKPLNSSSSSGMRRYLFMNSIGYSWSVKNSSDSVNEQKSITISFFDRTTNKDYHFIDSHKYDLCSMNERGVVLACSGYKNEKSTHKGKIFYRHHNNTNDSWDRKIPLLPNEYITSICLTCTSGEKSSDSIIVVGTNLGYVRFFNLYGLCVNLMKLSPIMTLIASEVSTVFIVSQISPQHFTYSLLDVSDDYSFLQQDRAMPLRVPSGGVPILKGIFFNEYSDPCVVAGFDDSLTILSHWREAGNARWVPLLNCKDVVTDYGLNESKANWKTWPLGLLDDKFICLVLKNSNEYPSFPLPLPIELEIKLPVKCFKYLEAKDTVGEEANEDTSAKISKTQEEDPEEQYLRSSTLGRLLNSWLTNAENDEEHLEKLDNYSVTFDKSLLKLFANACQESRLNKAFSIVRLIKNDKALLAASKIAERFEYLNLSSKISKLREDLMEFDNDQDQ